VHAVPNPSLTTHRLKPDLYHHVPHCKATQCSARIFTQANWRCVKNYIS